VTTGDGGGTQGSGGRRYAPSQAELRDPVRRARAARRLRDGGPPTRDRIGRGVGVIVGLFLVAGVFVVVGGVLFMTVLRPAIGGWVTGMAYDNPSLLGMGWVSDLVRDDLGPALTTPASSDTADVEFMVAQGDTAAGIADRLHAEGLLADPRTFVYLAVSRELADKLETGTFVLRKNMTPEELVTSLLETKVFATTIALRDALRIEQVAAYLQTLPIKTDVEELYALAKKPPASIRADYPLLEDLPEGASLEGYLGSGVYEVDPRIDAETLLRRLLDGFEAKMGDRLDVPAARGMTLHQVLTLASIVDREAVLDSEYAKIAGVYQNRLDQGMILNADPTVIYGVDSVNVAKLPFAKWPSYSFWEPVDKALADVKLPKALASFQTYVTVGLPDWPIVTPSLKAVDAALAPDTKGGYLYFVAIPDGGGKHAFAKTYEQHLANLKKYGYIQ
jgi:UPF0755 protein